MLALLAAPPPSFVRDGDGLHADDPAHSTPFGEHFLDEIERIDSERYGMGEYSRAVRAAYDRLEAMPAGTRVALYHGFGSAMPASYEPVHRERCGTGTVEIRQKAIVTV